MRTFHVILGLPKFLNIFFDYIKLEIYYRWFNLDDIVKARNNLHAIDEKKKKKKNESKTKTNKLKRFFLKYFVFEGEEF